MIEPGHINAETQESMLTHNIPGKSSDSFRGNTDRALIHHRFNSLQLKRPPLERVFEVGLKSGERTRPLKDEANGVTIYCALALDSA